ncbi:MAG: acyl carrier protein [Myxococcota bacterium]
MQATASTIDEASIIEQLTKMIARELDVGIEEQDIDPTVPLLEDGLMLDSMVLFQLITLIETRYGVVFTDEGLESESFASLAVLAKRVKAMIAARDPAPEITSEAS